jgi:hypothetical protein
MNRTKKIILEKIKKGEVKMKPKWWFDVVDKSTKSVWMATILLSGLAVVMVVYFIRDYNPGELWQLGEVGRELMVEDFPYWWLAAGVCLLLGSIFILEKIGDNYKKTKWVVFLITIISVLVATMVMMKLF